MALRQHRRGRSLPGRVVPEEPRLNPLPQQPQRDDEVFREENVTVGVTVKRRANFERCGFGLLHHTT